MRALLQNPGFRRLWAATIVLALGDALMQMGLLELFRAHGYNERVETAKLLFAVALPGLLLGPLAMAYLDRWQRRHVLLLSDALRALIVVGIAIWVLPLATGRVEDRDLLVVYALIFVIGAVTTFYYPARAALLPNLIDADLLIKANTLVATSLAVATVGGRALGGFVAEVLGVEWGVLANTLAYVVSVALVWGLKMTPHATTRNADGVPRAGWGELKAGLTYLWRHRTALPLVLLSAVFAFLLGILVVAIVGFAMDEPPNGLGLRTGGLGYLVGAGGAGAALGIGAFGWAKPWTRSVWVPFVQLTIAGILLVLLSQTTSVWRAVPLVVVLGAVAATVMIHIDAKMQEEIEDARRGAVFAARGMLTSLTMIVAFWLQFGTAVFRRTPAPIILRWSAWGALIAAGLAFLMMWARRRPRAVPSTRSEGST